LPYTQPCTIVSIKHKHTHKLTLSSPNLRLVFIFTFIEPISIIHLETMALPSPNTDFVTHDFSYDWDDTGTLNINNDLILDGYDPTRRCLL
jgi:hypothetical protein